MIFFPLFLQSSKFKHDPRFKTTNDICIVKNMQADLDIVSPAFSVVQETKKQL